MGIETHTKNREKIPSVNGVTPAPLRATISLLSEGSRTCNRCGGRRIDGLAGYLDDAEGRWVGTVHAECVLPEELGGEQPEPEDRRSS